MDEIKKILKSGDMTKTRALFSFDENDSVEILVKKFGLFAKFFFPSFFSSDDAAFHKEMDTYHARIYLGIIPDFLDICFRGAAKTTRLKLFVAFCIANDRTHKRKYIKVLTRDNSNSVQFVTDIYNLLIKPRVKALYPEIFVKDTLKREETMSSFTTSYGAKLRAGTVGTSQRGDIQDENRPDLVIFDDIEDRLSLMSAVITNRIWQNMDEAITGLAKDGGVIYCCNYISEQGNVHKLVGRVKNKMIVSILKEDGTPVWNRYTMAEINNLRDTVVDFEGDYLCKPNAAKDIYFDRAQLDKMTRLQPIKTIGEFKMFKEYRPDHRYAGGHDVAGGVGLDSSTSVFIDFDVVPAQVVGTFASNSIAPESFGDEMYAQANRFGGCLIAPENNKYDQAILKAKMLGANIHKTGGKQLKIGYQEPTTYGWNTNSLAKSKMLSSFRLAVEDGLIELNDENLILEASSYTRNDLLDNPPDIRLTTRHHDLLMAACIAWQMKDFTRPKPKKPDVHSSWAKANESKVNPAL